MFAGVAGPSQSATHGGARRSETGCKERCNADFDDEKRTRPAGNRILVGGDRGDTRRDTTGRGARYARNRRLDAAPTRAGSSGPEIGRATVRERVCKYV